MYRFIVIDDEDYIREGFSTLMNWPEIGFELAAALSSADEALTYLAEETQPVHVVLSDIRMGGMLGTELAMRIREKYPSISVVLISGYKDFDYALDALRADVFDYILKPFSAVQLLELFGRLKATLDESEPAPPDPACDDAAAAAMKYIRKNFQTDLTLEEVAGHVGMNPAYFSRYFKTQAGMNFIDYVTNLRMEEAKRLLTQPNLKIYQVCERIGYSSLHHFYRVFKQYAGLTPTAFKQAHQENKL